MRLLACGGRAFNDRDFVFAMLDKAHAKRAITLLIEGGAIGADTWARQWAVSRGVKHVIERAEWRKYGNLAGSIRNSQMLVKYSPDGCVAFPGNRGTADMVMRAKAAGVTVWEPPYHD